MQEVWKDIPGYEGYYQISTEGRVRSLPKKIISGNHGALSIVQDGCIIKPSINRCGYQEVRLATYYKPSRMRRVHRLVAMTFLSNPDNLPMVGHDDDDKLNNRLDNIYWTDAKENATHNDVHIKRGPKTSAALKAKYASGFKPYLPEKAGRKNK